MPNTKEVLYLRWNKRHLRAYFETLMTLLEKPFPADHFIINSMKDNPNRFILFLTQNSGKQTR